MNNRRSFSSAVPSQRERLAKLLQQQVQKPLLYPLSAAQQGLWFFDQVVPESSLYNVPTLFRIEGKLHQNVLEQSFQKIVERHEILRTRFVVYREKPYQVIDAVQKAQCEFIDLDQNEPGQRTVEELIKREAQRPFHLQQGSLFRLLLIRLAPESHLLLLTFHHIVFDGWSMRLLWRELTEYYQQIITGREAPAIKPLSFHYRDHVLWEVQHQALYCKDSLAYWEKQLAGAPELLQLPLDFPRPAVQTYKGAAIEFKINTELVQKLRRFSQSRGVTLFITLFAAFKVLLYRYSSQEDLVVGTPVAGRLNKETEALIGLFVNMLVVRTHVGEARSFEDLLMQLRTTVVDAYDHQDIPFEKLVEHLRPKRAASQHPLFQVMFAFHQLPESSYSTDELQFSLATKQPARSTAKFDLSLEVTEIGEELCAVFEYATALFSSSTINRMAGHMHILLEDIVTSPEKQPSQLRLLTATEHQQLLAQVAEDHPQRESTPCIHEIFEAQVAKTPDAPALSFQGQIYSYQELNRRANQLARYLQVAGVGPEMQVGVCLERSPQLLVALLAVLKVGAAYLPLDHTYPSGRVAYMMDDAQISVVIVQNKTCSALASSTSYKVINLDTDSVSIEQEEEDAVSSVVCAQNKAYIIYTSGSTGRPKGVVIEHRSTVALLRWAWETFPARSLNGVLASTSICFDLSVFELFLPLSRGGCVILVENIFQLLSSTDTQAITLINTVPSAMKELVKAGCIPPTTDCINLAGEALSPALVQQIYASGFGGPVLNLYGPTEDTTYSTCARLSSANTDHIPIGKPIMNTRVYILDRWLQPVPIGIAGELYIAGQGLARGYEQRPCLTAERFLPDPFSKELGARMYKTGDLAKYMLDGNISYLGRTDHQVKVRGFRIELEEIEHVLRKHPQVLEAVVLARADASGEKQLVAYVVAGYPLPSRQELRSFLQQFLPAYMLSGAVLFLDALPLTANGKLDRRQLPAPEHVRAESAGEPVAARDIWERLLVEIWEEVLNVRPVGVTENFFELGGNSLQAVTVMIRIQQQIGKSVSLVALLQQGTIEHLATHLREQQSLSTEWSPLVRLQPKGKRLPLFIVHALSGMTVSFVSLARSLGDDQPVYGLQSRGLEGNFEPLTRIEDMAACYIEAIQAIQPTGPYFLSGASMGGFIAFEMARQLQRAGHAVAFLALFDTGSYLDPCPQPFDEAGCWYWGYNDFVPLSLDYLRSLTADEQVEYVLLRLRADPQLSHANFNKGSTLRRIWLPNAKQILRVENRNIYALHRYQLQPYEGRITLLRAQERTTSLVEEPDLGWGRFARGGVEIISVPGSHTTMLRSPHFAALAQHLKIYLNATEQEKE